MKIRTIMATAATGIVLAFAGSSLAFGAEWSCPGGYEDCTGYEYCTTHNHGDCEEQWSGDSRNSNGHHSESRNRSGHHNRQGCGSHHR